MDNPTYLEVGPPDDRRLIRVEFYGGPAEWL